MFQKELLLCLFPVALFCQNALAVVATTHLDPMTVDMTSDCNSIFFQGIDADKGTAFTVPKAIFGRGPLRGKPIDIFPSETKGMFHMNVYLYFPATNEAMASTAASSRVLSTTCNWDKVKTSLNTHMPENQRIAKISLLPLTDVALTIPGIGTGHMTHTEGSVQASIIHYAGESIAVGFEITGEQREAFVKRVQPLDGIQGTVAVIFQAGSRDGSVSAHIDVDQVIKDLQGSVGGANLITKAVGTINLQKALVKSHVGIEVESGSDPERVQRAAERITEYVLEAAAKASNTKPSAARDASVDPSAGSISIKAIASVLSNEFKSDISEKFFTTPQMTVAEQPLKLQTTVPIEAGLEQILVQGGYGNPSSGQMLDSGMTLSIAAGSEFTDIIKYDEIETNNWVTMSDITELNLSTHFVKMVSGFIALGEATVNSTELAIGSHHLWTGYPFFTDFMWSRTNRYPARHHSTPLVYKGSEEVLYSLPVTVSFSGYGAGNAHELSELVGDYPGWSGQFDRNKGQLKITAHQDLGILTFNSKMSSPADFEYGSNPVVLDQVTEWQRGWSDPKPTSNIYNAGSDPSPLIKQRTIIINVGLAKAGDEAMAEIKIDPSEEPARLAAPVTRP